MQMAMVKCGQIGIICPSFSSMDGDAPLMRMPIRTIPWWATGTRKDMTWGISCSPNPCLPRYSNFLFFVCFLLAKEMQWPFEMQVCNNFQCSDISIFSEVFGTEEQSAAEPPMPLYCQVEYFIICKVSKGQAVLFFSFFCLDCISSSMEIYNVFWLRLAFPLVLAYLDLSFIWVLCLNLS